MTLRSKTITTKDWIDLINENKQLHTQLAKAKEREKDFIAYLHDAQKWFDKHDPNGHLQSSHPKAVKALNKFAIEKKQEAILTIKDKWIKKASEMPPQLECRSKGSSCYNWAMFYARELTDEAEQLRKEQDSE